MAVTVILGAQWGDEGKGKIVDLLSQDVDIVARFQGGANAGHTIVRGDQVSILHLIPSGIFNPGCVCILGSGMVIDPVQLLSEIEELRNSGVELDNRLFVSHRAHLIMPYHKIIEGLSEKTRGSKAIGVTGRGIGPAYLDKYNRCGIRIVDLLDRERFREKLETNITEKNRIINELHGEPKLNLDEMFEEYISFDRKIDPLVKDVSIYLNDAIKDGKSILCEGAQGTLLDVDWGTYPFVTSSNTTAGGAVTGLGIGPTKVDRVIGVIKAYTTRVGAGPFPTEFEGEMEEIMREAGDEYGAATGRPRRCGWFDGVIARFSSRINGVDAWALTKLDVLSDLERISICVSYDFEGKQIMQFPSDINVIEKCRPVLEELPGWRCDISDVKNFDDLPVEAKNYIKRIEELTETRVEIISVGSDRDQTIRVS